MKKNTKLCSVNAERGARLTALSVQRKKLTVHFMKGLTLNIVGHIVNAVLSTMQQAVCAVCISINTAASPVLFSIL